MIKIRLLYLLFYFHFYIIFDFYISHTTQLQPIFRYFKVTGLMWIRLLERFQRHDMRCSSGRGSGHPDGLFPSPLRDHFQILKDVHFCVPFTAQHEGSIMHPWYPVQYQSAPIRVVVAVTGDEDLGRVLASAAWNGTLGLVDWLKH